MSSPSSIQDSANAFLANFDQLRPQLRNQNFRHENLSQTEQLRNIVEALANVISLREEAATATPGGESKTTPNGNWIGQLNAKQKKMAKQSAAQRAFSHGAAASMRA
ncbi:hypothetical protein QQS21_009489 [Conoideocrella luteorostrata]|uniref:Uncharacterized protein n=1 Tax=Conoideocrella luteorostrata TaxID=1105319 RepID=A0AAJ0CL91_9HYPO|nr:hypothetical protein QQS21_009489 [Conoideocrella luteorostrata]